MTQSNYNNTIKNYVKVTLLLLFFAYMTYRHFFTDNPLVGNEITDFLSTIGLVVLLLGMKYYLQGKRFPTDEEGNIIVTRLEDK